MRDEEMAMAEALILEFEGFGVDTYESVNRELGIDMASGEGDWPDGMLSHTGAGKEGGWVVFEVWRSQADQELFMAERLGPALRAGGVTGPPTRVEWLALAAHQSFDE
jgi:hypothetical protein